jgi:NifB/MoaA-like Fe-S oxidoreductase
MNDADVDRIVKMRFSPLNISIHTTNPELRVKMMKNKRAGEVLSYLSRFKEAGLSMCGQIVLCKGLNDGEELLRSMRDLSEYFPYLSSVSVVPAGLTKYRDKLYPLTAFDKEDAKEVIRLVNSFGDEHKKLHGSRLFFAEGAIALNDALKGFPFYKLHGEVIVTCTVGKSVSNNLYDIRMVKLFKHRSLNVKEFTILIVASHLVGHHLQCHSITVGTCNLIDTPHAAFTYNASAATLYLL